MSEERPKTLYDGVVGSSSPHDELHTNPRVKELAGKGLRHPDTLSVPEIQELCGSVMRHIERHQRQGNEPRVTGLVTPLRPGQRR